MVVVGGRVFTTSTPGRQLKSVICEKCGKQFHYQLARVGVGKGSALYWLGQRSASGRSLAASTRDLAEHLNTDAEMVPCPACNWVNQDLIDRYRKRTYRRAPQLIGIIMLAGFLFGPLIGMSFAIVLGYSSRLPQLIGQCITTVCLLSPVWILVIRRRLREKIDPNKTYPGRPDVPSGTPPALVEIRDPKTGELILTPVPNSR